MVWRRASWLVSRAVPWRASILYAQATPRLREALLADPTLGPELHDVRRLEHAWPRELTQHGLPEGGLLAVPSLGPPDEAGAWEVPWDAVHGEGGPALGFASRRASPGLAELEWPPPALLRRLKHLAFEAGGPISLYRGRTHGGEFECEAAWLPGWAPGEPDRVVYRVEAGRFATAVGEHVHEEAGEVLVRLLEYHGLRLPSPYFAPHTRGFPWERHRVIARLPVPKDIPGSARAERPPPAHPRSLYRCVQRGDLAGASALLAAGCDPDAYAHERPLARAAELGRVDLVERLLAAGAEPGPRDRSGERWPGPGALDVAANVACAELLVAAGAELDPRRTPERIAEGAATAQLLDILGEHSPPWRCTPLTGAAERGHEAVARWLVARWAEVRPRGAEHEVFVAACRGDLDWLVELALAAGVPVDQGEWGDSGRTGLAVAAKHGSARVVKLLLRRGAELSEETWYAGCSGGALELIAAHLAQGQDVHATRHGTDGLTAAASEGQAAAVRLLLANGADPSRGGGDERPLHEAAASRSLATVTALLERLPASEVDVRDRSGWTPLFAAVWSGEQAIVTALLQAGASPEVVDRSGRSLREEAARRGIAL